MNFRRVIIVCLGLLSFGPGLSAHALDEGGQSGLFSPPSSRQDVSSKPTSGLSFFPLKPTLGSGALSEGRDVLIAERNPDFAEMSAPTPDIPVFIDPLSSRLGTPFADQVYPALEGSDIASGRAYLTFSNWTQSEDRVVPFASTGMLGRYAGLFPGALSSEHPAHSLTYGDIAIIRNRAVEHSITYFQTAIPERFQEYLDRFNQYKPLVHAVFEEFGLPKDLAYLSIVESGFNPRAYSRARAAGPWQFIKGTGRRYGLRVDWYIDERRDPVKSTVAAAHHLRDLYDEFGSWPLAMAAYNAGSGKVSRALRKSRTTDYWKIAGTRYLRRETKEYVPRFMAVTLIANNPGEYGFATAQVVPYQYDEVLLRNQIHLRSVAKATGVSYEQLRELNPELRRSITPSHANGYYLKVPVGTGDHVRQRQEQIQRWTQPPPRARQWYRVRWGDSLSVVARRFGLSVQTLKDLNSLSGNLIRVGDRLRVGVEPVFLSETKWYRVRWGDSLSVVAQRFGLTVQRLKELNNLSGNLVRAGDRLLVSEGKVPLSGARWYRVQRGDSLWTIAQRFQMTVRELKILNNLTGTLIQAGHRLLIRP